MSKPVQKKPSTDPYENMLMGMFVYRLGYRTGFEKRAEHADISVCQTQQTTLDYYLADLMTVNWSGGLLIEFKKEKGGAMMKLRRRTSSESKKANHPCKI